VLTAYERTALVRIAWQTVGGQLYDRYGTNRGADSEMARILSYLSSQRTHWSAQNDMDPSHELTRIYRAYQSVLAQHQVYAYDDLALHFADLDELSIPEQWVVACELQHATHAQLTALRRITNIVTHGVVSAWMPAGAAHPQPVPEIAVVDRFLAEYDPLTYKESLDIPAAQLIDRLAGLETTAPTIRYFGMATEKQPHRVGVLTATDELQLTAAAARAALLADQSVSIVCADTTLIGPLEVALRDQGIPLPMHSPPNQNNPLIEASLALVRCDGGSNPDSVTTIVKLLIECESADPRHHQDSDAFTKRALHVTPITTRVKFDQTISNQIRVALIDIGLVQLIWASPARIPGDVRDFWIREWEQWLTQLDGLIRLFPHDQQDFVRRIEALAASPQPTKDIRRTSTRINICGPEGAPSEAGNLIVIGLHEGSAPRLPHGYEMVHEDWLVAALREPPAALPLRTERAASRERERRRVAQMVASNARSVTLGFAYHGLGGQPQLPTAFFSVWGADHLQYDDRGVLQLHSGFAPTVELVAAPALPNPYQAVTEQTERILVQRDNHFSNSQIRNYLTCPRKYFYEKVARVTLSEEDRDDSGFALGNLMHEVLCAALGNGSTKNVDLREETFEFFAQRWAGIEHRALTILEHALAGTPCDLGGGQRYSPDKSYRDTLGGGLSALIAEQTARTMITRWVAAENKHLKTSVGRRPFLLEHEFSFVIDGMTITGRIDRVDLVIDGSRPRIEVIDYKTTSAKPPSGNDYLVEMGMAKFTKEKTRIDAALAPEATNYQTLMYLSTALPHVDGAYPTNAMRYVYLNEDHKEFGIFRRIEVVADTTMVEQFSANKPTVLSVARAEFDNVLQGALRNTMIDMRHTPYPIKPGRHCKTCLYFSICDATVDNTNAEEE
jgi:CRISPR/Cas system-associated exonuclease Cas4 (RecB family)